MSTINVSCVDQTLTITNRPVVASGGVKTSKVKFTFDSSWTGYTKVCVFYMHKFKCYVGFIDNNGEVDIPARLISSYGTISFSVSGYNNSSVKTSEVVSYNIEEGTFTAFTEDDYVYINLSEILEFVKNFSKKEDKSNKVAYISSESTDSQYPSAKCLYDSIVEERALTEKEIIDSVSNRIYVSDYFPGTNKTVLALLYGTGYRYLLYIGESGANKKKNHLYEIVRSGEEGSYTYEIVDMGIGSGGSGAERYRIDIVEDKVNNTWIITHDNAVIGFSDIKTAIEAGMTTYAVYEEVEMLLSFEDYSANFVGFSTTITDDEFGTRSYTLLAGENGNVFSYEDLQSIKEVYEYSDEESLTIDCKDNAEYYIDNCASILINYPDDYFEFFVHLTTGDTAPRFEYPNSTYIGKAPVLGANEVWEISIKDGTVVAQKVGDGV